MLKAIQGSRKQLKALDNLSNVVLDVEEHFTDELHLFFQYLGRKVLANVDLENPLEAIFYQQVQSVVDEYWKEYEEIFSHYVDEGAIIGDVFYDILLGESKDHAKQFNVTKSKDNKRQFLDNNIISSETKELWAPNTKVAEHLDKYKFEATEKVKARVTDEINNILGEAYREGWGHRDVAEKIQQRFTDLSTYESRRIAQTEINTTRNMVQYDRLQLDGMEYKIWHSAHDTRTRKSHLKVDEEIVPINERFSNDLMYPGDKSGDISEWVNCRCSHAAYILPLGYEAPDFWPFTESDLVKVGSSLSKDYVPQIIERLKLIDGAIIQQREEKEPEIVSITPEVSHPYSDAVEQHMDDFERKVRKQKVEHLQFFTDDGLASPIAQGNWGEVRTTGAQQKWLEEQTRKGKKIHATHNHPTEYQLGEGNPTLLSDGDHSFFTKMNNNGINLVSHSAEGPDNRYTISRLDNYDEVSAEERRKAISWADAKTQDYVNKHYKSNPKLKILREVKADLKAQGIDWRTKMREDPEWWDSIEKEVETQVRKMREADHAKLVEEVNELLNPVGLAVESTPRKK